MSLLGQEQWLGIIFTKGSFTTRSLLLSGGGKLSEFDQQINRYGNQQGLKPVPYHNRKVLENQDSEARVLCSRAPIHLSGRMRQEAGKEIDVSQIGIHLFENRIIGWGKMPSGGLADVTRYLALQGFIFQK